VVTVIIPEDVMLQGVWTLKQMLLGILERRFMFGQELTFDY
jgi:hypothetical protein